MKISIIIPVLNEAAGIAASIRNAFGAGGDEVIVVDGGSTDKTLAIARSAASGLPECRVITCNPSRAIQMNAGAATATGDLFLFLHADSRLVDNGCEQILGRLKPGHLTTRRNSETDCQTIEWGGFKQRIEAPSPIYRLIEFGNGLRAVYRGLVYGDQGFFVTRSCFESSGPFPEVPILEDYLLSRKLTAASIRKVILPGPLFVDARRWEKNGPLRQTLRNWSIIRAFGKGATPNELLDSYPRHDQ